MQSTMKSTAGVGGSILLLAIVVPALVGLIAVLELPFALALAFIIDHWEWISPPFTCVFWFWVIYASLYTLSR